jgi:tRNA pseudouridine55 synthase
VLLGARGAMRLMNYVHEASTKSYSAVGMIGIKTNSGDVTGEHIALNSAEDMAATLPLIKEKIVQVMEAMLGKYEQRPPSFSATKFEGKALYEYAREGIHIEKEAVERHIYALKFDSLEGNQLSFSCEVGTGTYVRTLFEDICAKFGLYGHLISLKRTKIGDIKLSEALDLEELSLALIEHKAISVNRILQLPEFILTDVDSCRFLRGQRVIENPGAEKLYLVHFEDRCLGLMDGQGQPKLVFPD